MGCSVVGLLQVWYLALYPGLFLGPKKKKRAWYPLSAHAQFFPTSWEFVMSMDELLRNQARSIDIHVTFDACTDSEYFFSLPLLHAQEKKAWARG